MLFFEEGREIVEPLKSNGPKTKETEKARSHQNNSTLPPVSCWDLQILTKIFVYTSFIEYNILF
jgi:hypothetical protein